MLFYKFFPIKFRFLQQSIHTVAQQLNRLFTKNEARVWACITVGSFVVLCKEYNLHDVF